MEKELLKKLESNKKDSGTAFTPESFLSVSEFYGIQYFIRCFKGIRKVGDFPEQSDCYIKSYLMAKGRELLKFICDYINEDAADELRIWFGFKSLK